VLTPVAKSELLRMQGSPSFEAEIELLHAQASSNFEMMVQYKQTTRSLEVENTQLSKQVQFLKKNIHLTTHDETMGENKELLAHCTLLREHLKGAAMETFSQQAVIKRQRRTIRNLNG
jgi:hypothetical protein